MHRIKVHNIDEPELESRLCFLHIHIYFNTIVLKIWRSIIFMFILFVCFCVNLIQNLLTFYWTLYKLFFLNWVKMAGFLLFFDSKEL